MPSTDSETVAATSIDTALVIVVCAAGLAAAAAQSIYDRPSVDLLALMTVAATVLAFRLNIRLATILHRQRQRRKDPTP